MAVYIPNNPLEFAKFSMNKALASYFKHDCHISQLTLDEAISDIEYANMLDTMSSDNEYLVKGVHYIKKSPKKTYSLHNGLIGICPDFFLGDNKPADAITNFSFADPNVIIQGLSAQYGIYTGPELRQAIRLRQGFRANYIIEYHCVHLEIDSCSKDNQLHFFYNIWPSITGLPIPIIIDSGKRSLHIVIYFKNAIDKKHYNKLIKIIEQIHYSFDDGEILRFDVMNDVSKIRVPNTERYHADKNNLYVPVGKKQELKNFSDNDVDKLDFHDICIGLQRLVPPDPVYCDIDPENLFINEVVDGQGNELKNNDKKRAVLDTYQEVYRDINLENIGAILQYAGASHMDINSNQAQIAPDDYRRDKKEKRAYINCYQDSGFIIIRSFSTKSEFYGINGKGVNITKEYYKSINFDINAEVRRRIREDDIGYENVGKIKNKKTYNAGAFADFLFSNRQCYQLEGDFIDPKLIEDFIFDENKFILMLQAPTGTGKTSLLAFFARLLNINITAIVPYVLLKLQKYLGVFQDQLKMLDLGEKLEINDEQQLINLTTAIEDRFKCITPEWFECNTNLEEEIAKSEENNQIPLYFIDELQIAQQNADFRSTYAPMLAELFHYARLGKIKLILVTATMDNFLYYQVLEYSKMDPSQIDWNYYIPKNYKPTVADIEYIPHNNEVNKILEDFNNFFKKRKKSIHGRQGKLLYIYNDKSVWNCVLEALQEKEWEHIKVDDITAINIFNADLIKLPKQEQKRITEINSILSSINLSQEDKYNEIMNNNLLTKQEQENILSVINRIDNAQRVKEIAKSASSTEEDEVDKKEAIDKILKEFVTLRFTKLKSLSPYLEKAIKLQTKLLDTPYDKAIFKKHLDISMSNEEKYNILLEYIINHLPKSRPKYVDTLINTGMVDGNIIAGTCPLIEGFDLLDPDIIEVRIIVSKSLMSYRVLVQLAGRFRLKNQIQPKYIIIMTNIISKRRVGTFSSTKKKIHRTLRGNGLYTFMNHDDIFDKTTYNGKISTAIPYSEFVKETEKKWMQNHDTFPSYLEAVGINVEETRLYDVEHFRNFEGTELREMKLAFNGKKQLYSYMKKNRVIKMLVNIIKFCQSDTEGMSPLLIQILKREYGEFTGQIQVAIRIEDYYPALIRYCQRLIEIPRMFNRQQFIKAIRFLKITTEKHNNIVLDFTKEQNSVMLQLKAENKVTAAQIAFTKETGSVPLLTGDGDNDGNSSKKDKKPRLKNITYEIQENYINKFKEILLDIDKNSYRPLAFDTTNVELRDLVESLVYINLKDEQITLLCDFHKPIKSNEIQDVKGIMTQFIDGEKNQANTKWNDEQLDEKINDIFKHKTNNKNYFKNITKHDQAVLLEGVRRKEGFVSSDYDKTIVKKRGIEYRGIKVKHDAIVVKYSDELVHGINKNNHRFITVSYSVNRLRQLLLRAADPVMP